MTQEDINKAATKHAGEESDLTIRAIIRSAFKAGAMLTNIEEKCTMRELEHQFASIIKLHRIDEQLTDDDLVTTLAYIAFTQLTNYNE